MDNLTLKQKTYLNHEIIKRFMTAALTTCAFSSLAHAQSSVELYGVVDMGVQYLSHTDTAGNHTIGLQSGNSQPSYFGIKGQEDLGGGYAATFRIEGDINVGNGQWLNTSNPFNRYSYVGLSTPYGTFTLGRQYNVMFDETLFYDPSYLAQFSLTSTNLIPITIVQPNNSIKFTSHEFDGLSAIAMYSFGQQTAGDWQAGKYLGLGLAYHNGPFAARGVYEQTNGSDDVTTGVSQSSLRDRRASIAATYTIGDAKLYGGFANVSGDLQLSPRGNMYWGAASYQLSAPLNAFAEYIRYDTRANQGSPDWYVIGATYYMSKRTYLYGYAGYLDNHGGKTFTLNTYDFVSPGGMSQAGVQLGIAHNF